MEKSIKKLNEELPYDKCWIRSKRRYRHFIKKVNKHLSKVRRICDGYFIRLIIKYKNNYAFYSGNLDFLKEIENNNIKYTNSFTNYNNNTLYNDNDLNKFKSLGDNKTINIIVGNNDYTYTLVKQTSSIYNKAFYLWTYGIYGSNIDDKVPTTQTTTQNYNLNVKPSDISWYPEPPYVINSTANIPNNFTMTVGFSGYMTAGTSTDTLSDPTVLGQCNGMYNLMVGIKCACLGGGTLQYTSDIIAEQKLAIENNEFYNYDILCFDIESYDNTATPELFNDLFKSASERNYIVIITTSHTAPYNAPNLSSAKQLMTSFFNSPYIDCITPQLYSNDIGVTNEYAANAAVSWEEFSLMYKNRINQNLIISPSIPSNNNGYGMYDLQNTGGTNDGLVPINVPQDIINKYPIDIGASNFLKAYDIDNIGSFQWMNGTLTIT